jgi:hypothetical protein
MRHVHAFRASLGLLLASLVLLSTSCVDAPSAPEGAGGSPFTLPGGFVIAPVFSLVSANGPALTPAQANALGAAFDRVDHFRMIVTRVSNGTVVVDTLMSVTPGSDQYDLNVDVPAASEGEQFLVTLIALEGTTELFKAENIPVQATTKTGGTGGTPPPAVDVPLTYTGPGATATAVEVAPGQTVVAPGGTSQMGGKVLDDQGAVIADAPLSWTSTAEAIATVSASGVVTGVGDGVAEVVATSPTGLEDRAWVYVVSGSLAYVQGGVVMVRGAAGGEAQTRSGGGAASGPTWAGDDIYYSEGGTVQKAGSSDALLAGGWPSVSPDGGTLAADAGGTLVFANIDGTNPTEGPSGTTPIWTDWGTLVVGGGSIETVRADGANRSTLVSGEAELPALSNGGAMAYVSGGKLMVQGSSEPLADVGGRPSWSPDGAWIAAPGGGGLLLVPSGGAAPPVPLPGLDGGTDPAWQGTATSGGSAPGLSLTGLDPDPAVPGQEVTIRGSGFDFVIPANNNVFWPGPDGSLTGDVISVSADGLRSVMPRSIVAGQIRVENRQGNAVLAYEPQVGSIEVHALTPWGTPVEGVGISVTGDSQSPSAGGSTDSDGIFVADALLPGSYTVDITVPDGYTLDGATSRTVAVEPAVEIVELTLTPAVASVVLEPANPTLGILDEVGLSVTPLDVNGNVIPEIASVSWGSSTSRTDVWSSSNLITTLVGRQPSTTEGDATFWVSLNGRTFGFAATVTTSIGGTIIKAADELPAVGLPVVLSKGDADIDKVSTDNAGRYLFKGLLAGSYVVKPETSGAGYPSPTQAAVAVNSGNPRGTADFTLTETIVDDGGAGEVIVLGDINYWGSSSYFNVTNNPEMTRNFVTNGSRTKTVWYQGHNGYGKSTYTPTGYFSAAHNYITGTVGQTLESVTTGSTGSLSIGNDVASFWMWMPQDAFDAADVAALNTYLAGGGRIILIGENSVSVFDLANQRVQELMHALGSSGMYVDGCEYGQTSDIESDPLMADVTTITTACTSHFNPGAGDETLVRQNGKTIIMRLRLGAPVTAPPSFRLAPPATGPGAGSVTVIGDPSLGGTGPVGGTPRR